MTSPILRDNIVDEILWAGCRQLPSVDARLDDAAVRDVWEVDHGVRTSTHSLAIWSPIKHGTGWACPVWVEHRTDSPRLVPGAGPLQSVMNAIQIIRLFHHDTDWSSVGSDRYNAPPSGPPRADWRPPIREEIVDVWIDGTLRVGDSVVPATLGYPAENPNDPGSTWYCELHALGMQRPGQAIAGSPFGALKNAVRVLQICTLEGSLDHVLRTDDEE